ncbi:galactofuranosyltransferase [Heyndrickxia coagulans]|uniref:hypothetical protein n=1 Tax=Heyndrickxia TaxID=2837504 RepID=UPI003D2442EC
MKKYILDIIETEKEHAGSKAKSDISFFLHDMGFLSIFFDREISRLEKYMFVNNNIKKKLKHMDKGDLLVVQYPLYTGEYFFKCLLKQTKEKQISTVLVIHDIESIRDQASLHKINKEMRAINSFDVVVSHNKEMTKWLQLNGITKKIIELGIFDYRNNHKVVTIPPNEKSVVFAGNLVKSNFIKKIDRIGVNFLLYGPNPPKINNNIIKYKGVFSPEELPLHLKGNFGLVWDGTSLDVCDGKYGEYLKYNNPHKTSLYLSCGIPVIIWKEAALADFISKNNLGICIQSLHELDHKLNLLDSETYIEIKQNVLEVSKKIRNGFFIKMAIKKALIELGIN